MDEQLRILLVYEARGKRPVALARVDNTSILLGAAEAAICESEARAALLAETDTVLGEVEREEVKRLTNVLHLLLPELRKRGHSRPNNSR
jgi:hypothetical protein